MARIGIDIRKIRDFGIGTYIRNLVSGLHSRAHGHDFVLLHAPDDPAPELPATMERASEPSGLYSLREPFSLGRTARRLKLDLLHCPHYVTPFRPGCPVAVTIHDLIHLLFPAYLPNPLARFYAAYFLRRAVRRSAVVFTVSEGSRADILARLPATAGRVLVTPNALDPACFAPPEATDIAVLLERIGIRTPYILAVGNNKPHKNLAAALEAFAIFRRRAGAAWSLVYAGGSFTDPHAGAAMLSRVEEGGMADSVVFAGYLPTVELHRLYAGAAMFIFPSLYEGFGLPPLEAMALGAPVVASNRSVMPEILGDAALLTDPEPALLAAALERLAEDDSLRADLIARGRTRARQFTLDRLVETTLDGYLRALEAA